MAEVEPARHDPDHLVVGHISKPHGTKGEVFVWPLTDRPEEVLAEGRTLVLGDEHGRIAGEGETLEVERERPFKRGQLVKFSGRDDRSAVEDLTGRYVLVPAGELRELEQDEVFYHQLLDAEVVTTDGDRVGRVREVYETEPAHLLEVKSDDGRIHLVPFAKRIVKQVDTGTKRITIAPPPGLLEL